MVDLPHPVLPSTATISPCAISNESLSTATKVPLPSGRGKTLVTPAKRMNAPALTISGSPLGHRPVAQEPAFDRHDGRLHHQHEQNELQGPGDCAGHVEQLLLPQELVADPAGC